MAPGFGTKYGPIMRSVLLAMSAALLWAGCSEPKSSSGDNASKAATAMARWRFAGGQALRGHSNAPALRNVLTLPSSAGVGSRLGTNLTRFLLDRIPGSPGRTAEGQLYPLVEAVLENESAGEVTDTEWVLAVRGANLPVAALGQAAAVLPRPSGSAAPSTLTTNGWWVVASSPAALARSTAIPGFAPGGFGLGQFDLPRILGQGHDDWPAVSVSLSVSNATVRTAATMDFAKAPLGELEAWKVPDEFVRDPLVRFSALRGAAPLLEKLDWPRFIVGGEMPGQVVSWAQPEVPFRSWFGFPVKDIPSRIEKIHQDVKPFFGTADQPGPYRGQVAMNSNKTAVVVGGKQMACTPRVVAATQGADSFLVVGFFAGKTNSTKAPTELLSQIQKPNLAFFEWEITSESWPNWNVLAQYNQILLGRAPNPPMAKAHRWMSSLTNQLGNTITQVERVTPTRYQLSRKSDIGLNGFELVALTRWLDADFGVIPGRSTQLPPVPVRNP